MFSASINYASSLVDSSSKVLACTARVGCSTVRHGAKSISYLWGASGMKKVAAPYVEPITYGMIDLYEGTAVITKVAMGKIDPRGFEQEKLDEMAKPKTPAEIAIISTLMTSYLAAALVVVPLIFLVQLFTPPKVQAVW